MLLAACSDPAVVERHGPDDGAQRIACARGAEPLRRACIVERRTTGGVQILTLRNSDDGSFRRLQLTDDGRGVIAADGAEPARVSATAAGGVDVAIGTDRYRLPAAIGARP